MKSLKSYIPSLIVSIMLVFTLIGVTGSMTAKNYLSSAKFLSITEQNNIVSQIQDEIKTYYRSKYNETGVPAEVYTSAITDDYIADMVKLNINEGFNTLKGGKFDADSQKRNSALEKSISDFFEKYAADNGYTKDAAYDKKLSQTIDSAYGIIMNYCDVYKMSTLNKEGILSKASKLFVRLDKIVLILTGIAVGLAVLLIIINIREISSVFYWIAASAFVSSVIGLIPCIYLNATRYFDAFVIKQPQVFISFTSIMYKSVNSMMLNQIILIAASMVIMLIYFTLPKKNNQV